MGESLWTVGGDDGVVGEDEYWEAVCGVEGECDGVWCMVYGIEHV